MPRRQTLVQVNIVCVSACVRACVRAIVRVLLSIGVAMEPCDSLPCQ